MVASESDVVDWPTGGVPKNTEADARSSAGNRGVSLKVPPRAKTLLHLTDG